MIGVIADDLTGAADVGAMFTAAGYSTKTVLLEAAARVPLDDTDVVVIDTETRHARPSDAYRGARQAARLLKGARFVYKKIDSAFRGRVGPEIDAVLDELGLDFAPIVPAFPAYGRTTLEGRHYIDGQPLDQTEMASDPLCPMTDSLLPRILGKQTRRPVHVVPRHGDELAHARRVGGMAVLDATSQTDLERIAEALQGEPFVCGASALAGELAKRRPWGEPTLRKCPATQGLTAGPILVVSGSVSPAARAQIERLAASGSTCVPIQPAEALGSPTGREAEAIRVANEIRAGVSDTACVFSPADPVAATEAQRLGKHLGLSPVETGARVAELLAQCATRVLDDGPFTKLIVFGGSTALAVCRALDIVGHYILAEFQPGVPLCTSIGARDLLMVLKPGSFGSPDFVAQAGERMTG